MAVVLVVDDDAAALDIRKLVLERRGYEVTVARDRMEAEAAFAAKRPDVVMLDLRLPDAADGRALIREFHQAAKIVVLCGNRGDIDGREEAAMVAAILTKPVRSEVLLKHIQEASQ